MNYFVVLQMGLPMEVQNQQGNRATIELNSSNFVVCRYHPDNSAYLNDAELKDWFPVNVVTRKIYLAKIEQIKMLKTN